MQLPTAADSSAHAPRHVVRPEGVLADLLGESEIGEDELLLRLQELGLIAYPSPLLGGLLGKLAGKPRVPRGGGGLRRAARRAGGDERRRWRR